MNQSKVEPQPAGRFCAPGFCFLFLEYMSRRRGPRQRNQGSPEGDAGLWAPGLSPGPSLHHSWSQPHSLLGQSWDLSWELFHPFSLHR